MKDNKVHILIVGSRSYTDYEGAKKVIEKNIQAMLLGNVFSSKLSVDDITKMSENAFSCVEIVSGGASSGADVFAKKYAEEHPQIQYTEFPADWEKNGKAAGYIRNREMHKYLSQYEKRLVIAFWDGQSRGTAHSFSLAKEYGNDIVVIRTDEREREC